MPHVTVDGLRFHVQRMGDGDDTVVFLHGLVMDNLSSWWYTLAPAVARHAETILYDMRGHGLSDQPDTGYTVADAVADLAGLLDALGVSRAVHLVGNSFGGVVGLAYAIAHPERTASLVAMEAHASIEGQVPYDREKVVNGLELAGAFLEDQEVARWLDEIGGRRFNRMARHSWDLLFGSTLVDDLRLSPSFSLEELAAVRCPVLAIYGEHSDIKSRAAQLAAALPDCTVTWLEGCTHSVLMEAIPELRRLIIDWVARHAVSGRPTGAATPDATHG